MRDLRGTTKDTDPSPDSSPWLRAEERCGCDATLGVLGSLDEF